MMFAVAIVILSFICIPYLYYAISINAYISEHRPEGFEFAQYKDAWKIAVGAIVIRILNMAFDFLLYPLALSISKEQDD